MESTTTRPKATPDYRVFEERENGMFELLTPGNPVKAPNRKAAIRQAGAGKNGPFLAIRQKEYSLLTAEEAAKTASKVSELEARIAEFEAAL